LGRSVRVAQTERLLDGDLVEGVGPIVHALGDDPGVVGLHLDLGLVVLDSLDGDENLHCLPPEEAGTSPRTNHSATSAAVLRKLVLLPLSSHPSASSSSAPNTARFTT